MLGKLPDLLNKNFVIGYFMPAFILLVGVYSVYVHLVEKLVASFDILQKIHESQAFVGTTLVVLLSWIAGILLLAINRNIIRFLEGYGSINPLKLFLPIQIRSFRRLRMRKLELDKLRDQARTNGKEPSSELLAERTRIITRMVWDFPDSEEYVLPTSFGNVLRSFEVYPRVMYGVDSIPAWSRLYAVIPKDYREALDDAKALMDFWINLMLASILILGEYLLIAAINGQFNSSSVFIAAFLVFTSIVSYNRATTSALGWGNLVRSSFDLFLDDLRLKLGYLSPASPTRQREMWTSFSRAVYYVDPDSLPPRGK
jgi:hypothetical protein